MVVRALTVSVPAAVVAGVAWASGGYFPRTWGALLLLAAIGIAAAGILGTAVEVDRRAATVVCALLALAVWQVVSTAWAVAPDAPPLEAERTLVYAGAAALAFLSVGKARGPELLLSVLVGAGVATVGGLLEHALGAGVPDERLELPVGYTNASGILATTTLVLGLGLVASTSAVRRAAGGGLAVPAAVALALSLSRGSVLAAALGLLVLCLAGTPGRELGRVGLAALPAAVAVVVVSSTGGLGDAGVSLRDVLVLVVVGCLAMAAAFVAARLGSRPVLRGASTSRRWTRRTAFVAACAAAAAGLALAAVGVHEVRQSRSAPTGLEGAPDRLLSTSTSSRGDYWAVAARMVEADPFVGAGAGGFTRVWVRERPALLFVRDAHNLYLETLAELGPLGLALLLAALGAPLLAARRAATRATGRAAVAVYAALLAHAALDWDWELPAVSLCTVFAGVALAQLGGDGQASVLTAWRRAGLLASATVLGSVAVVAHAGNGATADATDLLDRGDAAAARPAAAQARRYRPWAAEPWRLLGEVELAAGRLDQARSLLRRATSEDPGSWEAWLSLSLASEGSERSLALARVRALNPLAPELAGISARGNP